MIRRSSLIALEIVLGLMAALAIGVGVAWWRLSQGPVELGFIREHVQAELSQARAGRPVSIDRVELAWSSEGGSLELRAVGVRVEDGRGQVLSRAQEARIWLGAVALLTGRISLRRAEFVGGDVTVTRKAHGEVQLAFGPPGSPPDIIIPPPPPNETLAERVGRVLDAMEQAFRPVGPGGRLQMLSAREVKLAIVDEGGGGEWTADAADFDLSRDGAALALSAAARLEGARGLAPAQLRIATDTAFQAAIVEFGAEDARPRALLSPAALGPFAGLDAPMSATISVGLDRKIGITRLEGEVELGRGAADMAGGRFSLHGGRLRGRYDIDSDELIIDQLQLAGARTGIRGEARIRDASRIMQASPDAHSALNIALPAMTLDVPGVFSEPVDFADVQIVGAILSAERTIRLDRLHARTGQSIVDASGRIYWAEAGADARLRPGIALTGAVSGPVEAATVVRLWPMTLGEGAREYVAKALLAGRATEATARIDVTPADVAAGALRDESLDVRFNFSDGQFRFIDTMSPLMAARGSAVLRGNRFDLAIAEARLNDLVVTNGRVELPRLKPKGAMATFAGRAEGDARRIVEILLQEPLDLAERLPIHPETASGRGVVNFRLQRAMLSDVPYEDLRFSVDGRVEGFGANMNNRPVTLANGRLDVRGDHRAIRVSGPIRAGSSDVEIAWTERLGGRMRTPSRYEISGVFDARDLVRLGYPIAQYAEGRVGVVVGGVGAGFDVDHANVQVDLRRAAVESPFGFWVKQAGQAASARFDVARAGDGAFAFTNISARGAGLVALGAVRVGKDGRIEGAQISRLAVEGRSDAQIDAARAADGLLTVDISGPLFDAAPFMDFDEPEGEEAAARAAEPPLSANVVVDRLKMQGGATLENARVRLAVERGALAYLIGEGRGPGASAFSLALGPRPAEPQGRIHFRAEDAGFAMRALTGAENVVGGTATAEGDWRAGPPSRADFTVRLRDFQVVRLPAMARLLSSVGSLTGLVETLNGEGIGFSSLEAPMTFAGGRIDIKEARTAGPALGLTASGAYDIGEDDLDVDGVVVPSYGLNSMLGGVPILGDLLISRRGEGVFGMTYSLNGAVASPRVRVNPVSVLTPGIFRRIFEPIAPRAAAPASGPGPVERAALPPEESGLASRP